MNYWQPKTFDISHMRNSIISRAMLLALPFVLVAGACGGDDDDTGTTPPGDRVYSQIERLGNPLVSEVFFPKRDHGLHNNSAPSTDVANGFAGKIKAFTDAFNRGNTIGNTLGTVLVPDMLMVFPNRAGSGAGWLSWALANGYGGRKLTDDVVDAGLTAVFGPLLGDAPHKVCDNFALPLCTDTVADPGRHTDTFPYLKPPA